jgi:hypothetical protein
MSGAAIVAQIPSVGEVRPQAFVAHDVRGFVHSRQTPPAADEEFRKAAAVDTSREVARLLRDQAGVIARRQALDSGSTRIEVDRLVRRRDRVRLLPGVYVDHTGEPTWLQRCWGGILYDAPAALAGTSASRLIVGPGWRHHDDAGPALGWPWRPDATSPRDPATE